MAVRTSGADASEHTLMSESSGGAFILMQVSASYKDFIPVSLPTFWSDIYNVYNITELNCRA